MIWMISLQAFRPCPKVCSAHALCAGMWTLPSLGSRHWCPMVAWMIWRVPVPDWGNGSTWINYYIYNRLMFLWSIVIPYIYGWLYTVSCKGDLTMIMRNFFHRLGDCPSKPGISLLTEVIHPVPSPTIAWLVPSYEQAGVFKRLFGLAGWCCLGIYWYKIQIRWISYAKIMYYICQLNPKTRKQRF